MSINEIKKIMQQLNLKLGISTENLHVLLRMLSEEAFNTTGSAADKLRMLFIHIRNPCKLFYQVSLNFNIQNSSSSELEVDQLDFEKIKSLKNIAKDPPTQDTSQKVLRNRYLSTSPDSVALYYEKSPKDAMSCTEVKKTPEPNMINLAVKRSSQTAKAGEKPKKGGNKTKQIKNKIEEFKCKQKEILMYGTTSRCSKKIVDRRNYMCSLKERMFGSAFVKQIIFNAWKGLCDKLI